MVLINDGRGLNHDVQSAIPTIGQCLPLVSTLKVWHYVDINAAS